MQFVTSLAAVAILSLSSASAIPRQESQQFGVKITVTQTDINHTKPDYILDCNINELCQAPEGTVVSKLKVVADSGTNGLPTDLVECRQFIAVSPFDPKPVSGAPFTAQKEANVATNAVTLGPVICVLTQEGEN